METLRGLLALLCVFLAGTHAQDLQRNKFAGKFAEYVPSFYENAAICDMCKIPLHVFFWLNVTSGTWSDVSWTA